MRFKLTNAITDNFILPPKSNNKEFQEEKVIL